jgi:hypothetical protein
VSDPNLEEGQTNPNAAAATAASSSSSTGAVTPSLLEQNEHLVSPKGKKKKKKPKPVFLFSLFFISKIWRNLTPQK